MKNDAVNTLRLLLEEYRGKKRDAVTKEYNIYYAGAVDAISIAIEKLES